MLTIVLTTLVLRLVPAHASRPVPRGAPRAHNDNLPGQTTPKSVGVCDEWLAEFAPVLRLSGRAGEKLVVPPRPGEAVRRLALSSRGVVTLWIEDDRGRTTIHQSKSAERPFELETHVWTKPIPTASRLQSSSPSGEYLALRDERGARLWIVEARTGRVTFERTSFRREADGVHAHFNPRGRYVSVQRDGFMEIVDLEAGSEMVKGYSFGHALKDDDGEGRGPRGHVLQFESRGEIHVLSSLGYALHFFKSEPLLLVGLEKHGTYRHHFFEAPPPTRYLPTPVPPDLDVLQRTTFKFVDRPNQTGRGFVSPRETFAAELRYQYHEPERQSFLDVFEIASRRHAGSFGVPGTIGRVAFSPNERYVAVTTSRRAVRVWDLRGAQARAWLAIDRVPGSPAPDQLAFDAAGDLLVSAGADVWRFPLPD